MAPPKKAAAANRRQTVNENVYSLGVQGRKTVFLRDDGVRDENGLQPLDGLFSSSPAKGSPGDMGHTVDVDMSMDLEDSPAPDPTALLRNQQSVRRPIPRALGSPPRTNLHSPPRRPNNASPLRPSSIAPNGSAMPKSAARKLDFNKSHALPRPESSHATRVMNSGASDEEDDVQQQDEEEDSVESFVDESIQMLDAEPDVDSILQPETTVRGGGRHDDAEESEPEEPPVTAKSKKTAAAAAAAAAAAKNAAGPKKRGRKRKSDGTDVSNDHHVEEEAAPASSDHEEEVEEVAPAPPVAKRGRPAKGKGKAVEPAPRARSPKRSPSIVGSPPGDEDIPAEEPEPPAKRPKVAGPAVAKGRPGRKPAATAAPPVEQEGESSASQAKPKGKKGRPPTAKASAPAAQEDPDTSVLVQPRPPLPKRKGLVINRQKTPSDGTDVFHTRSGRTSYRPLAFWKNEHVERDYKTGLMEDVTSKGVKRQIQMSTIKEIYRTEDSPPPQKKGSSYSKRSKGGRAKIKKEYDDDEDEEVEVWEEDPGMIDGPVAVWQRDHEFNPPGVDDEVEVEEQVIAYSSSAIKTRDVMGASFRFTKLLNLEFFGTGVVDLPPGAEKKAKNSRKMAMTFIVHTGRVSVMVNNTTFSIGKGGLWIVPRGNYYSISNQGKRPSRIFFSQASEIIRPLEEELEEGEEEGEANAEQ